MKNNEFMMLDGRGSVFSPYSSQCAHCKFFKEYEDYTCIAFPEGIPDDILEGRVKHDAVITDQIGETVYTPI